MDNRISSLKEKRILFRTNVRARITRYLIISLLYLSIILVWGFFMSPDFYGVDYGSQFLQPSFRHVFGTDFMGRDMFFRCIKGLSVSLVIGAAAAAVSSVIALLFGITSAVFGGIYDKFINWLVDLFMGLPHLILLILISFMMGRGVKGVLVGVAVTHWPELTRLVRAEVLQLKSSQYVQASYAIGKPKWKVAWEHMVPHVMPVYLVGLVLLFPHAIMHEASITFLGFGLPADTPAIGVILSESMKHLAAGKWWLALFPGLMLLSCILLFDIIGNNIKKLMNPASGHL